MYEIITNYVIKKENNEDQLNKIIFHLKKYKKIIVYLDNIIKPNITQLYKVNIKLFNILYLAVSGIFKPPQ